MHDYQRQRASYAFDPETDLLGALPIIQSKIAITQAACAVKAGSTAPSRWSFYSERHTDLFAVLAEESSVCGHLDSLALYILLIMRGLWIAARAQTTFLVA